MHFVSEHAAPQRGEEHSAGAAAVSFAGIVSLRGLQRGMQRGFV